jgi:hypothetical protein
MLTVWCFGYSVEMPSWAFPILALVLAPLLPVFALGGLGVDI